MHAPYTYQHCMWQATDGSTPDRDAIRLVKQEQRSIPLILSVGRDLDLPKSLEKSGRPLEPRLKSHTFWFLILVLTSPIFWLRWYQSCHFYKQLRLTICTRYLLLLPDLHTHQVILNTEREQGGRQETKGLKANVLSRNPRRVILFNAFLRSGCLQT